MLKRLYRRLAVLLGQTAVILAVTIGLLEALVVYSFRHPSQSPIPLGLLRQMHELFDRNTIQVMPECAMFDATLTYTLRPGMCTFANREFSNVININSLGLRDDESSLDQPRVVVLGDSLAMGWGVDQNATFASVFERISGLRTLNAGISSFGTVRELRMFQRIDRRAVTDVVIQYSSNDFLENEQFVSGRFKTLDQENYERTVRAQADLLRYHPGKHAINLLMMLRNMISGDRAGTPTSRGHQASAFLEVLARSPVDLSEFNVTVLSLDPGFLEAVRPLAAASLVPAIQRLRFLDASSITSIPDAFYVLDDHPTHIGHAAVGQALADALTSRH